MRVGGLAVAVMALLCTAAAAQGTRPPTVTSGEATLYDRAAHETYIQTLAPQLREHAVQLKSRVIVPGADATLASAGTRRHVYVQFTQNLSPDDRGHLAELGVQVRDFVTNRTYVVDCPRATVQALLEDALVQGVASIWPHDKVPAALGERLWGPAASEATGGAIRYHVILYEGVIAADVLAELAASGISLSTVDLGRVTAYEGVLTDEQVRTVAATDGVQYVEPADRVVAPTNANAQIYSRAATAQAPPLNLDGSGITVLVRDENFPNHPDYNDRLTVINSLGPPPSTHTTHVTGTVAGSGAGNASAEGMAPAAEIVTHDFFGNDFTELRDPFLNFGAQVSNHSYGLIAGWEAGGTEYWVQPGGFFGEYGSFSRQWDDLVEDFNLIICKAAGNDRNDFNGSGLSHCHFPEGTCGHTDAHPDDGPYNCISDGGVSKNVITVGAVNHDNTMSSFSSTGPTNDGRLKPDVVSDGVSLLSTFPGNTYGFLSGTSMSTPTTAGSTALFMQFYRDNFGGGATLPSAALTKVCLIHGARDLTPAQGGGGLGFYQVGPDYGSGYGAVDIVNSIDLIPFVQEGSVGNGQAVMHEVEVVGTSEPLKVTLVWTDPPGSTVAANAIVNNLDLTVTAPDNSVSLPWVLNPQNPAAPATTGVNTVDVTEQVLIPVPQIGTYTVTVTGTSVPQGPQNYVLIATAETPGPAASGALLTAEPSSPQGIGATITWTAQGVGGSGDYEYRFFQNGPATGNVWTRVQDYGGGDTFTWNTSAADEGRTFFAVWVRNQGSEEVFEARSDSVPFHLASGAAVVSLTPVPSSPRPPGTSIVWTAVAQGLGPFEYQFFQLGPQTGGVWQRVQAYGVGDAFTWNTTEADESQNFFAVWARRQGSTDPFEARSPSVPFRVDDLPATGVTLSAMPVGSAQLGQQVVWTAQGEGEAEQFEYAFFHLGPGTGGVWTKVRGYSTQNTWTWTPTLADVGHNFVAVWVRNAGTFSPFDARSASVPYLIGVD